MLEQMGEQTIVFLLRLTPFYFLLLLKFRKFLTFGT